MTTGFIGMGPQDRPLPGNFLWQNVKVPDVPVRCASVIMKKHFAGLAFAGMLSLPPCACGQEAAHPPLLVASYSQT